MEKIKLVIWDLDETFWKGTLSEGNIHAIQENIEIVETLTNRGIINSICSKNDFEDAKRKLIELGVWDLFVFPSISWQPKGQQIQNIIQNCQLRSLNVLFLDDNHSNLEEAKFYNEGIRAEYPNFIKENLSHNILIGKDDEERTRLHHYKILESKHTERKKYSSNEAFLHESEITVSYIYDVETYKDRIHELIDRTNQLNYTKVRLTRDKTYSLLKDESLDQFAVSLYDKYGNYGVVGYVCYDSSKKKLLHFVFSCRILNLGVEQFIYQELDYPSIKIKGDVATPLKSNADVSWIIKKAFSTEPLQEQSEQAGSNKIIFSGSCDFGSILFYLKGYTNYIQEHVVRVNDNNLIEYPDHLLTILNGSTLKEDGDSPLKDLAELPFFSYEHSLNNTILDSNYDVLVYSVTANYGQHVYRHKKHGFLFAYGEYGQILTDNDPNGKAAKMLQSRNYPIAILDKISDNYEHIGLLSPETFMESLVELRKKLPKDIPIVFLNGAEFNPVPSIEPDALNRHKTMNKVLDEFLDINGEKCKLIDLREIIHSEQEMGETIRLFQRHAQKRIAEEIERALLDVVPYTLDFSKSSLLKAKIEKTVGSIHKKMWKQSRKIIYNPITKLVYRNTIKHFF